MVESLCIQAPGTIDCGRPNEERREVASALVLEGFKDFETTILTNFVSEPVLTDIFRIPYIFGEISKTFIDIDELDEFGV